jgi:hypothetical protein
MHYTSLTVLEYLHAYNVQIYIYIYMYEAFLHSSMQILLLLIIIIIIIIMALQPFVRPWTFFQFPYPIHSRQDSFDGGSACRKASTYTQNNTNTE